MYMHQIIDVSTKPYLPTKKQKEYIRSRSELSIYTAWYVLPQRQGYQVTLIHCRQRIHVRGVPPCKPLRWQIVSGFDVIVGEFDVHDILERVDEDVHAEHHEEHGPDEQPPHPVQVPSM